MGISRVPLCLLALPVVLTGCTQTAGVRASRDDGFKTIAAIGDRQLPIRSGKPDDSIRTRESEPVISSSTTGRLSGRVYDDQGEPVSNAQVRLGVNGETGGKMITAVTDQSGAFTLRGVRSGSSYTIFAKSEGADGQILTGRTRTEAPDTNVKISLKPQESMRDAARATVKPASPQVAPISDVEELQQTRRNAISSAIDRESLDPPAPEADSLVEHSEEADNATRVSAAPARDSQKSDRGWSTNDGNLQRDFDEGRGGRPKQEASRPKPALVDFDEDEVNPLPPALAPKQVGKVDDVSRGEDRSVVLAQATSKPDSSSITQANGAGEGDLLPAVSEYAPDEGSSAPTEPRSLPQGLLADSPATEADALTAAANTPSQTVQVQPVAEVVRKPVASVASQPSRPRPKVTWGELIFQKQPIPLDESLRKTSLQPKATPSNATPKPVSATAAKPLGKDEVICRFDNAERRLIELRFRDSQGRVVSFDELDSDLILLDFWGTWCQPCIESIPHMNEIQRTLGGKKVQVIGVACEREPNKAARTKLVNETATRLKVNYPVLVTGLDAFCPVQDAFQVDVYPTMVLLDRKGNVIWRERGATEATLARMDRYILRGLKLPVFNDLPEIGARSTRSSLPPRPAQSQPSAL